MSVWVIAIDAARIAVKMPIPATITIDVRGAREDRVRPGDEVDAGVDHRRGVDQRRDRGRALHRVRQPDVERELGALADGAREDEQGDDPDRDREVGANGRQARDRVADVQGPRVHEDRHDPEREPDVADAVDEERLLRGERGGLLVLPEPDEQVARQPDQLPGDEDDEEVVREDEQQHRDHEQVQVGEEPPVARVMAHVADRVDVDEEADRQDDDQEAGGQVVDEEPAP